MAKRKGGCPPRLVGPATLAEIIEHYVAVHRPRVREELRRYADQPSLARAIESAALCVDERGKRLSHQRRIPKRALVAAADRLRMARRALASAPTFEALHDVVERVTSDIPRVGELTVYDVTHRIAAWLRMAPNRVYLHAGTRLGARRLGLNWKAASLDRRGLPKQLRRLRAHEVEDVLCMYKDLFRVQ